MKKQVFLIVLLAVLPVVSAQVMITEVMYNPTTSESDTEYVELYNQGSEAVDIGGWYLNTTSVQMSLPEGTTIGVNKSFLIADEDDNGNWPANWPQPDYALEEITLGNTDSGVQLVDNNGGVVDVVGWGSPEAALYETQPCADVAEGNSLTRIQVDGAYVDTDNNILDFEEQAPNPQSSSSFQQSANEIVLQAEVFGMPPNVDSITITPDDSTDLGVQVMPQAGAEKLVTIEAQVTDEDDNVESVSAFVNGVSYPMEFVSALDAATADYKGEISFMFFEAAQLYEVVVRAVDTDGGAHELNDSFEYLSLAAFDVDASQVIFSGQAGSSDEVLGDLNMSTLDRPTVRNLGNVMLDFQLSGTDLSSQLDTIDVSSVEYTFLDNDFTSSLAGVLGYSAMVEEVNLEPGENMLRELTLKLLIPASVASGSYSGSLYLAGVAG
ncbi:lamin tail domain-containing protein [Candidatus Woesearchaeota archaeon]|nr:lamin tail domain-containing protein [Candidatus Woesearchaeota archaeon]